MQSYIYLLLLFYCQVVSKSLWLHGWQHFRILYPLLYPGVCLNSCPLSWWCYPTILFSVPPSSGSQSFPASRYFPVSRLFTSRCQSIRASASASVLPVTIQSWFPLGLTGLILLAVQGTLKSLLYHHRSKASILQCLAFFRVWLSLSHIHTCKRFMEDKGGKGQEYLGRDSSTLYRSNSCERRAQKKKNSVERAQIW